MGFTRRAATARHAQRVSCCPYPSVVLSLPLLTLTLLIARVAAHDSLRIDTQTDPYAHSGCMHDILEANLMNNGAVQAANIAGIHNTAATYETIYDTHDGPAVGKAESPPYVSASSLSSAAATLSPTVSSTSSLSFSSSVQPSSAPSAANEGWRPIRIHTYKMDLYTSTQYCSEVNQTRPDFMGGERICGEEDIFTDEKRDLLVSYLLPRAIELHAERLMVQPLASLTLGQSMDWNNGSNPYCGSFTSTGIAPQQPLLGVDFVLFVAAGPVDPQFEAWAFSCGFLTNNRPTVGVINVSPRAIMRSERAVRIIAHELLHALGFSASTFQKASMLGITRHVRGKPAATSVTSSAVLLRSGNHFGCESMVGMELDDSNGIGTVSSHWLDRNAHDDLMSPTAGQLMKYTAITMAAMEDLGFYKPNYDKAEYMDWGFGAGCDVLNHKCVLSEHSIDSNMFCDTVGESKCTSDRHAVGTCLISERGEMLPSYYQYFSDPSTGGSRLSDYCPVILRYSNGGCSDGSADGLAGSVISNEARCLDRAVGSALALPICADVQCNATSRTYKVRFLDAKEWADCPAGSTVDAYATSPKQYFWRSTVVCPSYGAVCPDVFNSTALSVTRSDGNSFAPTSSTADSVAPSPRTLLADSQPSLLSVLLVLVAAAALLM